VTDKSPWLGNCARPRAVSGQAMTTQTDIKMKNILLAILTISLLTNCNNSQTKSVDKNDRLELVPESDKELRGEH
jgi:hypothetical protein